MYMTGLLRVRIVGRLEDGIYSDAMLEKTGVSSKDARSSITGDRTSVRVRQNHLFGLIEEGGFSSWRSQSLIGNNSPLWFPLKKWVVAEYDHHGFL